MLCMYVAAEQSSTVMQWLHVANCLIINVDAAPGCLQVRELIYREILEYHPHMLTEYLSGGRNSQSNFMYPSAVDNFRRQFAHLESGQNGQNVRRQGQQNLGQVNSFEQTAVIWR